MLVNKANQTGDWPVFTREWMEMIIWQHVGVVCMQPMIMEGGVSIRKIGGTETYIVFLRNNFPKEMTTDRFFETIVHELVHIFHFIHLLPTDEDKVEADSVAFYNANKEFVKDLWSQVKEGPKCMNFDWESLPTKNNGFITRAITKRVTENRKQL